MRGQHEREEEVLKAYSSATSEHCVKDEKLVRMETKKSGSRKASFFHEASILGFRMKRRHRIWKDRVAEGERRGERSGNMENKGVHRVRLNSSLNVRLVRQIFVCVSVVCWSCLCSRLPFVEIVIWCPVGHCL